MSFNTTENLVYRENPVLAMGMGPIPVDDSSLSELNYSYETSTAPVIPGPNEPSCYNGVETLFDVRIPSNCRVLFNKSYLKITSLACDMFANNLATPVPAGVSIPWNPIAAVFDTIELQLNQSATTTEQITQNLGDGSMAKMLTRYPRDVIESLSEMFYTPCFESNRDRRDGTAVVCRLSSETQKRRTINLVDLFNGTSMVHAKNLYLQDMFDSLRMPSAFFVQNLQFKFRPKMSRNILVTDTGYLNGNARPDPTVMRYYVLGMQLNLTMITLTENQLRREEQKIASNVAILRESFWAYDAQQKTHSPGASYRDSNIKNMQGAMFMFPSLLAADNIGANRYQYSYGGDANPGSGITMYQMRYDSTYSPAKPLAVDPLNNARNTDLFAQYKALTLRSEDRELALPLTFLTSMGNTRQTATDESPYVLFCAQFYATGGAAHKNMAGSDHEIITSGGAAEPIIIVRIRGSFLEIRGDTSVYMIN